MKFIIVLFSFLFTAHGFSQNHRVYLNAGILHASLNVEKVFLNYGKSNTSNVRIGIGSFQYGSMNGNGITFGLVQNLIIKKHSLELGFGSNILFNASDKKLLIPKRRSTILPQFNLGYKYLLLKKVNVKAGIGVPEFVYLGIEYVF